MLDTAKIGDAVSRAAKALGPDVVRVRHNLGEDWTGEDAIFFRVVLSDRAAVEGQLGAFTQRVTELIDSEVRPWELGLMSFFAFRSASEQAEMKDQDWD